MRRRMIVAALLLCLPMVGEGQSIRYYPDGATMLTLGKPQNESIRYFPPSSTLRNGLLAYWNMDEGSGDRADSSGNVYTLTDNNTVTSAVGKISNAASFSLGSSEFLSNDSITLEGRSVLSLSAWINWGGTGYPTLIASQAPITAGDVSIACSLNITNRKFYCTIDDLSTKYKITDAAAVEVSTWYHVAVVYDGSKANADRIMLYVNGSVPSQTAVGTIPTTIPEGNPDGFWIGRVTNVYSTILIDEYGLWSRALTADEVTTLYNAGNALRP